MPYKLLRKKKCCHFYGAVTDLFVCW